MRRQPSCRACTASLLRVGCCGWLDPADGPAGYDERADQDATTDEHREGADHANWLSRGCAARGKAAQHACRASMCSLRANVIQIIVHGQYMRGSALVRRGTAVEHHGQPHDDDA